MIEVAGSWALDDYLEHLEYRISKRLADAELRTFRIIARAHFDTMSRCNALFHGSARAIHLTEVVLATLEGRWLASKQTNSGELRKVLLAIWCHSAAFADTLVDDHRLPSGIPNDGWWPWVRERSATLCGRSAQSIDGLDLPSLIALSQACSFAPIGSSAPTAANLELSQLIRAAWLISLGSDPSQATKIKPLWTALHYWSEQQGGDPLQLSGTLPQWTEFPQHWKGLLQQWTRTDMRPAIDFLQLTEDGREHLQNLQQAIH
jgi:hypothetical protein